MYLEPRQNDRYWRLLRAAQAATSCDIQQHLVAPDLGPLLQPMSAWLVVIIHTTSVQVNWTVALTEEWQPMQCLFQRQRERVEADAGDSELGKDG